MCTFRFVLLLLLLNNHDIIFEGRFGAGPFFVFS